MTAQDYTTLCALANVGARAAFRGDFANEEAQKNTPMYQRNVCAALVLALPPWSKAASVGL